MIALYYFDEAGFALDPTIPYAWQESKSVIELPARRYGRINVLGFMNRHNDLHTYMFEAHLRHGRRDCLFRCVLSHAYAKDRGGCGHCH